MESKAIIQHSPWGWSSYSSIIAVMKRKPLLNTYKSNHRISNSDGFQKYGFPEELQSCDPKNTKDSFVHFYNAVFGI
jgi:hypothetical protein